MKHWIYHSEAAFEARHALTKYRGEPESAHRHRWRVAVEVGTDTLGPEHYGLDFHAVHAILAKAAECLHETDLSRHPSIGTPSPTAERVAEFLVEETQPLFAGLGGTLLKLSVWEGPRNRVDLVL
ncbi:MAG: 6-carboxytetrahydropterin synthase [Thermoanaerobaculales bacterium]|nr:6-carboxytetrahydropterin synthase [Thermoanaerobaculales bacterium]